VLDNATTANAPTGVLGAMYYNSNTNQFMCYGGSTPAWAVCGAGSGSGGATVRNTLIPEFSGAVFTGDGTNNNGSLSSDFCSGTSRKSINTSVCGITEEHNYYSWRASAGSANDYDIYIKYQIPRNYTTGTLANVYGFGWRTSANESVAMSLYDDNGDQCGVTTTLSTSNTAWTETALGSMGGDTDCTVDIVANDVVVIKLTLSSSNTTDYARIGAIRFDYTAQ
jgi:hypothetical protein